MTNTFAAWRGIPSRENLVRNSIEWHQYAMCANEPLELFFGPDSRETEQQRQAREAKAKMFCRGCPVQQECLDYSLHQPEKYGVWGGMNEHERATERRWRMRKYREGKPVFRGRQVFVNPIGARRRLQAVSAVGRTLRAYAQLSGVPEGTLASIRAGSEARILKRNADRVAAFYEQVLAMDQVHHLPLRLASENGWAPPSAWDEATIDDPEATPRPSDSAA